MEKQIIALVVHGGAWDIPDDLVEPHRRGVSLALKRGWEALKDGASAVEVVEAAVVMMEDDETFNAGRGSFINMVGEVELDASIMDGKTNRAGAVAAVQNIKNPIRLARKIMEESDLVMLVGIGASRFAKEHKVPTCSPDHLVTARELERWKGIQAAARFAARDAFIHGKMPSDTVGAVALDKNGNLASGTSTGGTPNKYPGRVGDSPLIGSGSYADNQIGAVSCTGWGETLIRVAMAKTIIGQMEFQKREPDQAIMHALKILEKKTNGYGGAIAVNRDGKVAAAYNTPRMARGYVTAQMKAPFVAV
jgi:beta-aspartyl-peptidase (threonine type)